ncbi:RNA polymerase sigma factor [Sphingobacterium faecium]|uniref:RNA polymerase sigma factor n=1 Tax=Sphingobacterium faecium TaxID=34087 RepID=UPI0021B5C096|nr:RNA polymerase sigma factor [Sphingobacterium faecium]UXD70871.1 RNA polymerase sigma factor [Sphingobacterium faecium]
MENADLNVLFQEKRQQLNHFASQFTSDYDEREDLVQETFIRSLKSIHNFIHDPKLMTWLYVIMKNIYINHYRREKRKSAIYDEYVHTDYFDTISINQTENKMIHDDINKAFESLSEDNAEIFRMYLDGYKYQEIAEVYDLPEGTIKSRIHVIRKTLKEKLKMYQIN